MNGQLVTFDHLPSRGYAYPDDIEIYIRPISIKEQIDMERYGVSDAEYFRVVLDGVTISGNFKKQDLLHSDVQFLDLVRRLYSFDVNESITVKDCVCSYKDCGSKFDFTFKLDELTFSDFNKDIFGKHFILGEGTDDELEVVVSPITVNEFMTMSKQFKNHKDKKTMLSSMYTDYACVCIREVIGRTFKDKKDRDAFLKDYINNLWSAKDKNTMKEMIEQTIVRVNPFTVTCEDCGREVEVEVTPVSNFQQ